jgi:centrin-3
VNMKYTVAEKILARDPAEEIRRAFQLFDDDNTGKITKKNLKRVVRELNETLDDDELYVFLGRASLCVDPLSPY